MSKTCQIQLNWTRPMKFQTYRISSSRELPNRFAQQYYFDHRQATMKYLFPHLHLIRSNDFNEISNSEASVLQSFLNNYLYMYICHLFFDPFGYCCRAEWPVAVKHHGGIQRQGFQAYSCSWEMAQRGTLRETKGNYFKKKVASNFKNFSCCTVGFWVLGRPTCFFINHCQQ